MGKKDRSGGKPQTTPSEVDDGRALRGVVLNEFIQQRSIIPRYRPDVLSEADYEARQATLPLAVLWGEYDAPDGVHFTVSVNLLLVEQALARHLPEAHSKFKTERDRLHAEIRDLAVGTITSTSQKTGAPPSLVCQILHGASR